MTTDEEQIRDLLARYCLTLDLDDVDGWVALFTPDATYQVYGRAFEGHEGLRRMMRRRAGRPPPGRPAGDRAGRRRPRHHAAEPAVRRAGVGHDAQRRLRRRAGPHPRRVGASRRPAAASSWPTASRTARPTDQVRTPMPAASFCFFHSARGIRVASTSRSAWRPQGADGRLLLRRVRERVPVEEAAGVLPGDLVDLVVGAARRPGAPSRRTPATRATSCRCGGSRTPRR